MVEKDILLLRQEKQVTWLLHAEELVDLMWWQDLGRVVQVCQHS